MALIKQIINPSQFDTKCPYSMTPIGHCIHNTANDATAQNERDNVNRSSNTAEVSFHVAVDDKQAIQLIDFNRNAWAAGDGGKGNGNRNYIHWEICYSKSGGTRFLEAEKRLAREIAADLKSRGWGIDRVKKHQDFSGKYCPHRTLDLGYNRILDMIKAELGDSSKPTTPPPSPSPSPSPEPSGSVYYRVVAGSYSDRSNAERTKSSLISQGYDSFLLPVTAKDGKTYLRVIAGSFTNRASADARMNELISKGYQSFVAIYEEDSNDEPTTPPVQPPVPTPPPSIVVGSKVNISTSATKYATGQSIPSEQKGTKVHTVQQITGDRSLLKEIVSWVYTRDLVPASESSSSYPACDREISRQWMSGRCVITTRDGIYFRNKPCTCHGTRQGTYSYNESVNYDLLVTTEKYVWVSWISASTGARRYMPVVDRKTGDRWANY